MEENELRYEEEGATFFVRQNGADSGLSEWEVRVLSPAQHGPDHVWEATVHDRGVFLEIPAVGLFINLRWKELVQLCCRDGTHWDAPCGYGLTEAGREAAKGGGDGGQ